VAEGGKEKGRRAGGRGWVTVDVLSKLEGKTTVVLGNQVCF
jgi:hypothetical protein